MAIARGVMQLGTAASYAILHNAASQHNLEGHDFSRFGSQFTTGNAGKVPSHTNHSSNPAPAPATEGPHTVHHGDRPIRTRGARNMPRRRRYGRRRSSRRRYRTRRRRRRGPPCVRDLHKLNTACSKHFVQHVVRANHPDAITLQDTGQFGLGANQNGGSCTILMDRLLNGGLQNTVASSNEYQVYMNGTPTNMDTMSLLFSEYRVTKCTVEATYIDTRSRGVITAVAANETGDYSAGNVNLPVGVGGYLDDQSVSTISAPFPLDALEPQLLPQSKMAWVQPGGSARFTWRVTPRTLHPGVDVSENDIVATTTTTRAAHPVNIRLFSRRCGTPNLASNSVAWSGIWIIRVWRDATWSNKTEAQT